MASKVIQLCDNNSYQSKLVSTIIDILESNYHANNNDIALVRAIAPIKKNQTKIES